MPKKKMRMGRVVLDLGYAVDLNNEEMVEHAKQCIYDDICSAIKYNEVGDWIDVIETPKASPDMIPEFLLENDEE